LDSLVNSNNTLQNWNLKNLLPSEYHDGDKMPVITSLFPNQNAAYNVNNHTLNIIKVEINRGNFFIISVANGQEILNCTPTLTHIHEASGSIHTRGYTFNSLTLWYQSPF